MILKQMQHVPCNILQLLQTLTRCTFIKCENVWQTFSHWFDVDGIIRFLGLSKLKKRMKETTQFTFQVRRPLCFRVLFTEGRSLVTLSINFHL